MEWQSFGLIVENDCDYECDYDITCHAYEYDFNYIIITFMKGDNSLSINRDYDQSCI